MLIGYARVSKADGSQSLDLHDPTHQSRGGILTRAMLRDPARVPAVDPLSGCAGGMHRPALDLSLPSWGRRQSGTVPDSSKAGWRRPVDSGENRRVAVTHKRFLWNGDVVPACGAPTGNDVSLSDTWAIVTCTECLRCRPTGR